ncbi:MAG: hypothetical protein NXI22_15045 [bacterium]|nr:hypothetical protein [bacterium]
MPPDTFGDYTPDELVSLSELLQKQADEIRAIAEAMRSHQIEGMRMRNRRSIMESIDKAQTFAHNGWKSYVEARDGKNDFGRPVGVERASAPKKTKKAAKKTATKKPVKKKKRGGR